MVWLKPYGLIAAGFIFHPNKVSTNFTVCYLSIALALNFLLDTQQCQCNEQPPLQPEPMAADRVPAQQRSCGGKAMGIKPLRSKGPSLKDGLLWTCTPLLASSARCRFLPYVALHRELSALGNVVSAFSLGVAESPSVGSLQRHPPKEICASDPRRAGSGSCRRSPIFSEE